MREPADLALVDGKVITCDQHGRVAQSVAIKGDRFIAVGSTTEIRSHIGDHTKVIDLHDRAVIPGLIDTHAHMDREGLKSLLPSLSGVASIRDVLERIAEMAELVPAGEWIVTMPPGDPPHFRGVSDDIVEKRLPNRWELDSVAPRNPVFIRPPWGYWNKALPLQSAANSLALELTGISAKADSPWDGLEMDKDPRSGEPTGVFREHTMMPTLELLFPVIPRFSAADRLAALRCAQQAYHSFGTTSIFESHGVAPEVLGAYQSLADTNELTMRSSLVFSPSWRAVDSVSVKTVFDSWLPWLSGRGLGNATLRIAGIYTAAGDPPGHMFRVQASPYTGWAGFCYDSVVPHARAREIVLEAARSGIRITTIFTDLLEVFEEADQLRSIGELRWVLSHVDRLSEEELRRLKDLGVVVTFHTNRSIAALGSKLIRDLGADRASEVVPMRTLLEMGVPFALSTDNCPVSLFHPISHCVTRRNTISGERIAPDQALTPQEALNAATAGGAYVTFEEDNKGTIASGALADLAILSNDPLTVDEDRLSSISADVTIVGGRIVFERVE